VSRVFDSLIAHPATGEPLPILGTPCCDASAFTEGEFCTCWDPVYDLPQSTPDPVAVGLLAAGVQPSTRDRMCGDCAYRPGSPERSGDESYQGDPEELERIANEDRFWCHQGMRRISELQHPVGIAVPGHPASYRPPIIDAVPYQANGEPALLCAGWAARHRALTATASRAETEASP
jgi:hypothetical protein